MKEKEAAVKNFCEKIGVTKEELKKVIGSL